MISARQSGQARITRRRALRYQDGGDPRTGRPPHVRAASGLAWQQRGTERVLVAPQDDTSFLAVLAPPDGPVSSITLDYAPGGLRVFEERAGTKRLKLDLESIAALDGQRALLVGSGSHENRRRIVVLEGTHAHLVECAALYEMLRQRTDFAGSELNIEGATRLGAHVLLANRSNGAPRGSLQPVDAIALMPVGALLSYLEGGPTVPVPDAVHGFELGSLGGGHLGFTDLATLEGSLWFLACAERSPNAYDDGEVVGAAMGHIDLVRGEATWAPLIAEDGTPSLDKPEGLAMISSRDGVTRAYACVDADDPDVPSDLITIELRSEP